MARLAVVGCGYVGTVTAACFAELGHHVACIDTDAERVAMLSVGRSPIYEPGLDELLARGLRAGRLSFSSTYPRRLDAEIAFVAVNTPASQEGAADLRAVRDAVSQLAPRLPADATIVNKSTVPIGTAELVQGMARRSNPAGLSVVSNPEFLREGSAIHDFMHPDRVVLGAASLTAAERVAELYRPLGAPVQVVGVRTAEMIKYASNAFLAAKISFINEMAAICESLGADVEQVAEGMGSDRRIGPAFLQAGLGWGGSCFPKDVRALAHMAAVHGTHPQLLRAVMEINSDQRLRAVQKLADALGGLEGRRILVLGAAFKAQTDDVRNSPALELAELLVAEGCEVSIHDPVVSAERISQFASHVGVAGSLEEGFAGADAVVLATAWPEYLDLDWRSLGAVMRTRVVLDARNSLEPETLMTAGLRYLALGRALPPHEVPGAVAAERLG